MIVSFTLSNFRSFSQEQTFTLVASKRLAGEHIGHTVSIPDSEESALRVGVIYGANAAGKSNLLKALQFLKDAALSPRTNQPGTGREVFRFADLDKQPTTFDLQFIASGKLYRFGLSLNDDHVTEEWLVRVIGSKEKNIYERSTAEDGTVRIEATDLKKVSEKLGALITVGGRANQSFLATVRANLEPQDAGDDLLAVMKWMSDGLKVIAPGAQYASLNETLSKDESFLTFAGDFLKAANTGINNLQIDRKLLSEEELSTILPRPLLTSIAANVQAGTAATVRLGPTELLIDKTEDEKFYQIKVQAAHKHRTRNSALLQIQDESDGTKRLLNLLPALHELHTNDVVYFIDEIDRSMHPMLVYKFLEYFLNKCRGSACQIVATTHETNLLNLELLRRDEIWFAEKDQDGATHLYSLTDFAVRKDLQIRKGYLEGRFGSIPFLGDLDRLVGREHADSICH